MILKIHKTKNGIIVALCDENIVGKKFTERNLILDLTADFYKGEKVDKKEALKICRNAYIINAVGKEAVKLLLDNEFAAKENIIKIAGTPSVQCLVLQNEI